MTENVLTLLPPRARKAVYIIYGLLGLAGTGILAYYGAVPDLTVPPQVFGGLAVLGALSPAFSVLAASNVKPPAKPEGRVFPDHGDETAFGSGLPPREGEPLG